LGYTNTKSDTTRAQEFGTFGTPFVIEIPKHGDSLTGESPILADFRDLTATKHWDLSNKTLMDDSHP
jgi:hypothetical protein